MMLNLYFLQHCLKPEHTCEATLQNYQTDPILLYYQLLVYLKLFIKYIILITILLEYRR